MTIELRPLHDDFGIEILNVDISAGLDDAEFAEIERAVEDYSVCLLYTSPSPRDISGSRMPSSA